MAAVALNTFKTIRHELTTSTVGIYTAPIGVASIVVSAQIANVSTGTTTYLTTFSHYRADGGEFDLVKNVGIPVRDALSIGGASSLGGTRAISVCWSTTW